MGTIGGEIFNPEKIKKFHKKLLKNQGIPKWISETPCFMCGEELGDLGVRGVGLKLNAARIGDIVVEAFCGKCQHSYDFYYRNACTNFTDFTTILKSPNKPSAPVSQMNLLPADNNLLQQLIELDKKGSAIKTKKK